MLRSIKTFFRDPEPTPRYDEIAPGLNIVEGIVTVDTPLRSPVRQQNCVAFFYRSFLVITGGRAPAIHKLKEAAVYTPFNLEMQGGNLAVIPAKPGSFSHQEHLELGRQYGKDFQGVEDIILPGARVRLRGNAQKTSEGFIFKLKEITVVDKQAVAAGVVGDRKKRKKRKK